MEDFIYSGRMTCFDECSLGGLYKLLEIIDLTGLNNRSQNDMARMFALLTTFKSHKPVVAILFE